MHASQVLEFGAIRDRLQAHCETSHGAALAAELDPSFEADDVWRRLALTAEAYDVVGSQGAPSLGAVRDLRGALLRASKGSTLDGADLFQIADALAAMRSLKVFLQPRRAELPGLWQHAEALPELKRLEDTLYDSLDPSGDVKDSASATLASLRQRKKAASARIIERVQAYTSGPKRDLLSDPIYTVRDGRYVVPLKAEHRGKIRGIVHDTSGSGQTIYVEPEDVLQLGNALREVEAAEREEVLRILISLSAKAGGAADEAIPGIEAAGYLDFAFAKAKLGYAMRSTMPRKTDGHCISIHGGRHPLLNPENAVPLDLTIGGSAGSVLITGPNTGGKTVAIKTVGLFVLMAQSGMMVPALDVRLGPFTQIWADIGDEQSLQQSLSTFSGHIKNIAESLRSLRKGALVLLDEIGAGTDPAEGAALARAILEQMRDKGATILASTHYGELKAFAYNTEGFQNAAMEFDVKTLRPTYRLIMGAPGASHALKIAERYGIPKETVERARQGLGEQEQDVAMMLEKLEQAQRLARQAQGEADRRTAELKKAEETAARKLAEAEEIRKNVHSRAGAVIEDALREIRLEAARLFEELKKSAEPRAQESVRQSLKELQEVGQEFAQEFRPKASPRPANLPLLKKGMQVKIEGYTQVGVLLDDPKNGQAQVQMGPLKMSVAVANLVPVASVPSGTRASTNIRLQRAQNASTEIHLRAKRAEEATEELERFIDEAVLAGLPSVRIVHGKGEGILRKITQDYLRRHPHVATYRDGEPGEGGSGVTVAVFK
jgi:DNA mismatch repair protein MutS2